MSGPRSLLFAAVLASTHLAGGCGLVDSDGRSDAGPVEGSGGADGSGGTQVSGTGGLWVEGCSSPSVQARSFCYADCPNYDGQRAMCDPACTANPATGCPATGGIGNLIEVCTPTSGGSPAYGGMGGLLGICPPP